MHSPYKQPTQDSCMAPLQLVYKGMKFVAHAKLKSTWLRICKASNSPSSPWPSTLPHPAAAITTREQGAMLAPMMPSASLSAHSTTQRLLQKAAETPQMVDQNLSWLLPATLQNAAHAPSL